MLENWFFVDTAGSWVCVPAKCGGTSFYRSAFGIGRDVPDENVRGAVLASGRAALSPEQLYLLNSRYSKLLAVRHPMHRFMSLWRNKCRDDNAINNGLEFMKGWTPEELLSAIKASPLGNEHWADQSAYLVPGAELIRSNRLLSELRLPEKRANMTEWTGEMMSVDLMHEVQLHYARDLYLWSRAK